ncbi:MAG: hypothetical protein ACRCYR_13140 [Phycicoccus sp.]
MDTRDVATFVLFLVLLMVVFVGVPFLLALWATNRRAAKAEKVIAQVLPGERVLGVATGHIRRSRALTVTLVALGIVAVILDGPAGEVIGALLLIAVIAALVVTYRHALVATTPDEVVVVTANGSLEPQAVLGRIPAAAWQPTRSLNSRSNAVAGEVVVIDALGQRSHLPEVLLASAQHRLDR